MFIDRWHEIVEPRLMEAALPTPALQSLCIHCARHTLSIAEVHYWNDAPRSSWATLRQVIDSCTQWIDGGRPKDVSSLNRLLNKLFEENGDEEADRPVTWRQMADGLHEVLDLILGDSEDRGEFELAASSLHHFYETLLEAEIQQNIIPISPPGEAEDVLESLMSMTPDSVESTSETLAREIDFQLACIARLHAGQSLGEEPDGG